MKTLRLPIVGVMGSGSEEHAERAREIGAWLAGEGVHLLTGGGGGVMAAVSRAFAEVAGRRGLVLGVLPAGDPDAPAAAAPPESPPPSSGYPNPWVEVPIATHLPLSGDRGEERGSRNHINVLSSDVIVALPGSAGTASEVRLASRYGRPLIAYLRDGADIPGLPDAVPVTDDLRRVQAFVREHLAAWRELFG